MKKNYILLTSIILISFTKNNNVFAQKEKGQSTITLGVGVSAVGAFIRAYENAIVAAINISDPDVKAESSSLPVLFGSYDYSVTDVFSIGAAGSFQSWTAKIPAYTSTSSSTSYAESSLKITRTNFALRPLFHFGKNEALDMYAGARLGYTLWNVDIKSTDPVVAGEDFGKGNVFAPAILFGTRYYFTENIGFSGEVSIGAPYAIALGLNARF